MIPPTDQARRYLANANGAISGSNGHSDTFSVACCLVQGFNLSIEEARPILQEFNQKCQPPWSERELDHKLKEAEKQPAPPQGRGHRINRGVRYVFGDSQPTAVPSPKSAAPAPIVKAYDLDGDRAEIPPPMPDGTRELIKAVFQPGEGIRIAQAFKNSEGKEIPRDVGLTLSREEWLSKLDAHDGNPNGFFKTKDRTGIYVSVNPMKIGGSKDTEVTSFRHCLIEWDKISREEQWNILLQSKVPVAVVVDSGGKSIHAWVKVNAKDREEFSERVKVIYDHFEASGVKVDSANKNPSRFSRLAGCERGTRRQELLAVNIGSESFTEWLKLMQDDKLGPCLTIDELQGLDTSKDPDCVIGFRDGKTRRYLCRGKSAWIVGPSGVGKSSLITKFAIGWALNREVFGIAPARALKSLIVQAENDRFDLAEMIQGCLLAEGIDPFSPEYDAVTANVVFKTDATRIGQAFLDWLHRLIDRERPDIVWIDPLLSFAGIDVNRQEEVSQFLRQGLNRVMEATGVVIIGIHHTGKMKREKNAEPMTALEYAYMGIGSSEMVNWARAVMTLVPLPGEVQFKLMLAKRGNRAGAKHPDGMYTPLIIYLEHSKVGISWTQISPDDVPQNKPEEKPKKEKQPSKIEQLACCNNHDFLAGCLSEGEGCREIMTRLEKWAESKNIAAKGGTFQNAVFKMVEIGKLKKTDGKYFKGPNA